MFVKILDNGDRIEEMALGAELTRSLQLAVRRMLEQDMVGCRALLSSNLGGFPLFALEKGTGL